MLDLDRKLTINRDVMLAPNLLDRFTERDVGSLSGAVWGGYDRDKKSRVVWEKRNEAAMDLAMQISAGKSFPWPGCSNVVFPLITIAGLQFSARSYGALVQGTQIVRYQTFGKMDASVLDRAKRIGKHMSWQALQEDEGWEEQHDRLLINLAIIGCNFVKTYFDSARGYPVSELVMAKDLVIDYYARSTTAAARLSHRFPLYRNEIYERSVREVFLDVRDAAWFKSMPQLDNERADRDRRQGISPQSADEDTPFQFIEQHRWFDLDGDGYAEPYIATIEESSKALVRLTARWESEDDVERIKDKIVRIKPETYFTKYSFIPSPDGGIYDMGFGLFLGPLNEAINSAINQMIDFGTMQNSLGGLLGRGAKIRGGVYTMAPWEFKRVDATGDDLKKSIYMWPDRAPPDFLFKLIGFLVEYANRVAGTVDSTVGENPGQNTPASTFQGMTEMGLQVYKRTFKSVWRSMKNEFQLRFNLNKNFCREHQDFGPAKDFIRAEDYTVNPEQIAPVANPNISSASMKMQTATMVKQSAMATPGYDIYEVEKQWLEAQEVEGIDIIYPGPGKVPQEHMAPNPKAAVEQMKLQGIQMKLEAEKMKWAHELQEEHRLNEAKIRLLEAQALKAASEAQGSAAAQLIEAYNDLIQMHKSTNDMINKRIQALAGEGGEDDSDGGSVSGVEGKSNDSGDSSGVSLQVPGGSNVAVDSGSVQQ